jgi:DNA-directed RNA polymerase specialized sigma24 family protein
VLVLVSNEAHGVAETHAASRATGDAAEFERLMREHVPRCIASAYRWTGASIAPRTSCSSCWCACIRGSPSCASWIALRPWALRVMYRIFVDGLRRERASPVQFGAKRAADRKRRAKTKPGSIPARARRAR